jgi:hypothetical protein
MHAVKYKSTAPPALRKDGGFELGRPSGDGRMKFFERSVQPSSKRLLKKYGINVRADPITVSSFSKQKMDAHSSDDEGAATRSPTVSEIRRQPGTASDLTSGESSENEASHFDGNHFHRARSGSVGGSEGVCSR